MIKIKKRISLLIVSFTIMSLWAESNNTINNNYYKVVNDNSQKIIQKEEKKECLCENQSGKKLVSCTFELNHSEMLDFFMRLPINKKREFLKNLSLPEYEHFIASYQEDEWHQLHESLADYEKQLWPSTVKEQTDAINHIKETAKTHGRVVGYSTDAITLLNPFLAGVAIFNNTYAYIKGEHPAVESTTLYAFIKYMESIFEL